MSNTNEAIKKTFIEVIEELENNPSIFSEKQCYETQGYIFNKSLTADKDNNQFISLIVGDEIDTNDFFELKFFYYPKDKVWIDKEKSYSVIKKIFGFEVQTETKQEEQNETNKSQNDLIKYSFVYTVSKNKNWHKMPYKAIIQKISECEENKTNVTSVKELEKINVEDVIRIDDEFLDQKIFNNKNFLFFDFESRLTKLNDKVAISYYPVQYSSFISNLNNKEFSEKERKNFYKGVVKDNRKFFKIDGFILDQYSNIYQDQSQDLITREEAQNIFDANKILISYGIKADLNNLKKIVGKKYVESRLVNYIDVCNFAMIIKKLINSEKETMYRQTLFNAAKYFCTYDAALLSEEFKNKNEKLNTLFQEEYKFEKLNMHDSFEDSRILTILWNNVVHRFLQRELCNSLFYKKSIDDNDSKVEKRIETFRDLIFAIKYWLDKIYKEEDSTN